MLLVIWSICNLLSLFFFFFLFFILQVLGTALIQGGRNQSWVKSD